jgi:hypothetical protein
MRVRAVLTTLALLGALLGTAAGPAQAHPPLCAGTGVINTPPTYYTPPNGGNFNGSFGVCTDFFAPAFIAGEYYGTCLSFLGDIAVNGHHRSSLIMTGSVWLIGTAYGTAVGTGYWTPAIGQSCLNGATQFQVTLVIATV